MTLRAALVVGVLVVAAAVLVRRRRRETPALFVADEDERSAFDRLWDDS